MTLADEIRAEVDPQGWNTVNDYDTMLLREHPLEWKPRKKDDKLRLSWSLLKSGLHCPRAATWAVYPEKFNVPEGATKFTESLASIRGNLVQTLLEHIYAHNYLSYPPLQLVAALQASWRWGVKFYKPVGVITPQELVGIRTEIFDKMGLILTTMNKENLWSDRREVEKPLWWDMPSVGGVRLTGKADFVLSDPGRYWLVDGKYSSKPEYLDVRQLTYYAIILQKMTGKMPTRAIFWLYPQGTIVDHSEDCLTPVACHSVLQDAVQVAKQIKSFDETACPSRYNCMWCLHKGHCPDANP